MYRYERSDLLLLILAWNMVFQIITDHSVQIHDFLGFIILGYIINTGILKARVSINTLKGIILGLQQATGVHLAQSFSCLD